jgi:hypothetical protein
MAWLSKRLRRLESVATTNDFSFYSSMHAKRSFETFSSEREEHFYRHVDIVLGISFGIVGCIILYQLYQSYLVSETSPPSRGRKVISLFNYLICFTCVCHGFFFLLPNSYLYKYYLFNAIECFQNNFHNVFVNSGSSSFSSFLFSFLDNGFSSSSHEGDDFLKSSSIWKGKLISEVLLQFGNLMFISIFMLICCYWYFMFKKAEETTAHEEEKSKHIVSSSIPEKKLTEAPRPEPGKREFHLFGGLITFVFSSIQLFLAVFILLCCGECVIFLFWLSEVINSQQFSLASSVYQIIILIGLFFVINNFEEKVVNVLEAVRKVNASASKAQIKRIRALTMLSNIFSISNVILELSMAGYLTYQFYGKLLHSACYPLFFYHFLLSFFFFIPRVRSLFHYY